MPGSGAAVEVVRVLFRTGLNPGGGDSGQNRRRSGRGTRSPRRTPPSATGSTPSGTPMPGSSMSTASIPNEQTLSGLRLIPDGALPPSPHSARASPRWNTQTLLSGIPHLARASGAPPPAPSRGRGQSWRYPGESRIGSSLGSPHGVDRGGIATGGRGPGRRFPLPAGGYPYVPPQSPRPPEGAVRGDTGEKPSPGMQPPG